MKKVKTVGLIVLGIVVVMGILFMAITAGIKDIKMMDVASIDLANISDGTYTGSFHKNRWTYDVVVTVKEHRIVEIKNVNEKMHMGDKINQKLAEEVIQKQSLSIDAVGGASIHTKAFCKAVENALTKTDQK